MKMTSSQHIYEVRPRNDHRGVDLISDVLPFGRLRFTGRHRVKVSTPKARIFMLAKLRCPESNHRCYENAT